MILAALDVDYRPRAGGAEEAVAAAVLFDAWDAAAPTAEQVTHVADVAPYEPGRFFARELPPLLAVLRLAGAVDLVLVDGYAWLGPDRPGLGAHLHDALGGRTPVVGVAKRPFRGAPAVEVLRGQSARPLYVTAAGVEAATAAAGIRAMHGAHRVPTLLQRVDRLCRDSR